jgi:hypothetical protein
MSIKYLSIVFIATACAFVSCTKEAQQPAPSTVDQSAPTKPYPITGIWQETKVVTYLLDPSGNKLMDTTYLKPFTAADYALFNNDGSCSVSVDHYYFQTVPGNLAPQAIPQLISGFSFMVSGSKYVMTQQISVQGPGGGSRTDTASMTNSNTLRIHTVAHGIGPNVWISDSYYNKSSQN